MSDPVLVWLAAQRDLMTRWLDASRNEGTDVADAMRSEMRRWWQTIVQGASPQAQSLAQELAQLGPSVLAGASDVLFDFFGTTAGNKNSDKSNEEASARWLDIAPMGFFREHQAHAQNLTQALADYQRIMAKMMNAIAQVHVDALELLAMKVQALSDVDDPVTDTRRLYNLWIESGEQAFAQHAHGESFGSLQGELMNAGVRLRMAQQTIADVFLKSLDLPTRAELNSVHKRLKEMRARIEQLEMTVSSNATIECGLADTKPDASLDAHKKRTARNKN